MSISKTTGWIGIFIVVALLGFISCDLGNNDPQEDVVDEITFIPMTSSNGMAKQATQLPSPYGCVLSTLNEENTEHLYRYQGFFIKFPGEVYRQARGKVSISSYVFHNPVFDEIANEYNELSGVVRVAHCKIPDSELAKNLIKIEIQKFENNEWLNNYVQSSNLTNEGMKIQSTSSSSTDGEWVFVCSEVEREIPILDSHGNVVGFKTDYYEECFFIWAPAQDGGGGDTGGGEDPNPPCDNPMDFCFDGGGGGDTTPPGCPEGQEKVNGECVDIIEDCDTEDELVNHRLFRAMADSIVANSNFDAPDDDDRQEDGGVFYEDAEGILRFAFFPDTADFMRSPCGIGNRGDALFSSKVIDFINSLGGTLKGILHSHPYVNGEIKYACSPNSKGLIDAFITVAPEKYTHLIYKGNPSPGDVDLLKDISSTMNVNINGYFVDKEGNIGIFDKLAHPEQNTSYININKCWS
jgi:hypothetical protein